AASSSTTEARNPHAGPGRRAARHHATVASVRPRPRPVRPGGGVVGVQRRRGVGRDRRGTGAVRGQGEDPRVLRTRRGIGGRPVPHHHQPHRRVRRPGHGTRHELRVLRRPRHDRGEVPRGGAECRHLRAHAVGMADRLQGDLAADPARAGGIRRMTGSTTVHETDVGRALIVSYLDAVGSLDVAAISELFHPDGVLDIPYAPEGIPRTLRGRDAIAEFYAGLPEMVTPMNFADYRINALDTDGEYVAEYT